MNAITICTLQKNDLNEIVSAFEKIGWDKPISIYETYLTEQTKNDRVVLVAKQNEIFCGYVTIKWKSDYPGFQAKNIPEISDLNVLPHYRKQGIGTQLINACEKRIEECGHDYAGIGFGMTYDYGSAQRLYIKMGYVPDGQGLFYKNKPIQFGNDVPVDDDLVLWLVKKL